jgi:hypothetical protein
MVIEGGRGGLGALTLVLLFFLFVGLLDVCVEEEAADFLFDLWEGEEKGGGRKG